MMTRRLACFFALSLLPVAVLLEAQTTLPAAHAIAPPVLPLLTSYRYWPIQFVQFVGEELPYSMVVLEVDPAGKHPLLQVTLTERSSGKRIRYTDSDLLLASAAASGEEAHKAAVGYEPADTENTGSVTTVRLTMADGKPLQFRFVQGSDISEQGSGLNPFPGTKIPVFAYREQGAVAGEGTALQIGNVVSNASVWKEISHPPYFIGYHGAETASAHTLVFVPGSETWTVTSAPATLAAGSAWELDGDHGDHKSLHIDKTDGSHITVTETTRFQPGVHCTLDAVRKGDGWSIERARFAPDRDSEKHGLVLQFAQPLSATDSSDTMTLSAGRKITLATATLAGRTTQDGFTLAFATPNWLSDASMTESTAKEPQGFVLSAHAGMELGASKQ